MAKLITGARIKSMLILEEVLISIIETENKVFFAAYLKRMDTLENYIYIIVWLTR